MHKGGLGPQLGQPVAGGAGSNCACLSPPATSLRHVWHHLTRQETQAPAPSPAAEGVQPLPSSPGALELSSWQSPPWSSLIPSAAGPGTAMPEQLAGS